MQVMFTGLPITINLLAGIAAGWAFHVVWRRILPRARSREFWRAMPVHASGMLHCTDPDDVARHYGALMTQTAGFAARNTLAVLVALAPVAALFLLSDALHSDQRRVPIVEVRPAVAATLIPASPPMEQTGDGGLLIDRRGIAKELRILGTTFDSEDLTNKQAFCAGILSCMGYQLMLFETHRLQSQLPSRNSRSVVVRPLAFAANPLWPYLDDLELAFLVGTIAGGIGAARRSPAA